MNEKPILFSGPMVRAILEGRKTQTRRVLNPQPENLSGPNCDGLWSDTIAPVVRYFSCPYGRPGDQLWVRESFCYKFVDGKPVIKRGGQKTCYYRATEKKHVVKDDGDGGTAFRSDGTEASPWIPSIHMPRSASRIALEITDIRVERLQNITGDDAISEGISNLSSVCLTNGECKFYPRTYNIPAGDYPTQHEVARARYAALWDSINKNKHPWSSNPWVWVVGFSYIGGRC